MAFLRTDNRDPPPDAVLRERALVAAAQRMAGGAPLSAGPGDAPCDTGRADGPAGPGRPAPHVSAADSEAIERLGARLPGYRIEREIHRGGQGVVYLALQRSTRRRVAIKVMKEGPFASADDRARFEREVRLLARLDHPSIVAIHDSGTAGGCFYIVMNYIEGLSLDAWMRDGDRTIEQTLRLFHDICEAVGAAHVRGIVHRDLKPSNIRVDAQGRPHVLDFGLAKAEEGSRGHGESIMPAMTLTGQFVGSLPWSSPEQAIGDAGGIDVRSDVYSLGVVLYQMLTGTFPYEVGGSMLEVARRIAHDEPIPPSEAIAQQSRLGRLFGDRGSERIDDDVETIVLKCLSKDRERRYQNAGELARDIGHYLAGEPIEAKRDSLAYVLGKQVKRYRLVVSFAALLVVVMLAGFVSSIVLWQRAEREALRAIEKGTLAEQREAEARQIAEFQQKMLSDINPQRMGQHLREDVMAEAEAAMLRSGAAAEQITARLEQVTAQLAAMNLTNVGVRSIDRNVLAPALVAVDRDFASQPLVQAALLESISKVYLQLGERAEALPLAERALDTRRRLQGNDSPDTLASVHATSVVLYYQLRWPEAEALAREAIDGRRRVLGPDHIDTMRSVDHLNLILFSDNKLEEAEQASRELLAQRRRVLGEDHLETLQSVNAVGGALWKLGRHTEVEPYWIEVMEKRRRLLGERHLDTLLSISNMGLLRKSQRRLTEAEAYFREAIAGYQDVLGDEHPETHGRKRYLGSVLRQQGRLSEAEPYLTEALAGTLSVMSEHSGPAMTASLELTKLMEAQGRYSDAEARYRRSLEVARGAFGNEGHLTLEAIGHLAVFLRARGELVESEALGAELASSARAAHSERLASYLTIHARTLTAMGRFEEAEAELLEAQAMHAARTAVSSGRATIWSLIELYDAWHAAEPGAGHDARADHWRLRLPPREGGSGAAGASAGGERGADAATSELRGEELDLRRASVGTAQFHSFAALQVEYASAPTRS